MNEGSATEGDATAPGRAVPVIVFARAPVAGEAKTRLAPRLGAEGAARLHARLVERALQTALAAGIGEVELCCAPDATHPFFVRCAERCGVALTVQGTGDLGARMHAAFARVLADADATLLIGSDCPALTPAYLRVAAAALACGSDAVIGPAEDGGYVLLGLARAESAVFDGIDWGAPTVMAATRERLRSLGWRWRELRALWDVDRPEDLARIEAEIEDGVRLLADAMRAERPE